VVAPASANIGPAASRLLAWPDAGVSKSRCRATVFSSFTEDRPRNSSVREAQYQQTPAPLGGGLVKEEWFRRYEANQLPESFDRVVQSWDTANKATELSDFSVCTTWGVKGKNLYLLGVLRKRLEYPDLKRAVREQQAMFNASVVLIEDKASGAF
jgi:phage terminase large subunit-like protein